MQAILQLGQLFLQRVIPKCAFRIHHKSKSTNVKLWNLHHIIFLIHRTNTGTKNLTRCLLLIYRKNRNTTIRRGYANKDDGRKTFKNTNNDRIMNPSINNNSCCTIKYINSNIKMVFATKSIPTYKPN